MNVTWPQRLPRERAKLVEFLIEHAWTWYIQGTSAKLWLSFIENKTANRRVRGLAPHVAYLVWSGFFDDSLDDESASE